MNLGGLRSEPLHHASGERMQECLDERQLIIFFSKTNVDYVIYLYTMPRRNYKKKKTNRRRKRRTYQVSRYTNNLSAFPIGQTFRFKTRYVQLQNELDVGVGGIAVSQVYSLTSLYDPYTSGTGHQPIGYDEMMAMYDHYTVIGARARVRFNQENYTANNMIVAISVQPTSTVSTGLTNTIENGLCKWTTLAPSEGGGSQATLVMPFSAKKYFNRNVMNEKDHQGSVGSSPNENAYLHVTVKPSESGVDPLKVFYHIEIDYIAILTEPKKLGQS